MILVIRNILEGIDNLFYKVFYSFHEVFNFIFFHYLPLVNEHRYGAYCFQTIMTSQTL